MATNHFTGSIPKRQNLVLVSILGSVFLAGAALGEDFTGTVTHVHDGDTAHVTKGDGTVVKVRFVFVDTPEIGQPFGIEARDFVRDLIDGEQVLVKSSEVDQHGRALGEIMLGDLSVNKKIIEEGYGWWFYHYHSDEELGHLEVAARSAKKGLFAAQNPIYPRNWRAGARVHGGGASGGSSGSASGGSTSSPGTSSDLFILGAVPNPRATENRSRKRCSDSPPRCASSRPRPRSWMPP